MRSTGGRGSALGALTRDRIPDAAKNRFSEHGVDGVSLREIIRRAGVNLAGVRHHSGSKEGGLAKSLRVVAAGCAWTALRREVVGRS